MFDLLDVIRKLLSQIIIGVRIIRWFGLMDELRYTHRSITEHTCFYMRGAGPGGALSIYTGGGVPQHIQKGGS